MECRRFHQLTLPKILKGFPPLDHLRERGKGAKMQFRRQMDKPDDAKKGRLSHKPEAEVDTVGIYLTTKAAPMR